MEYESHGDAMAKLKDYQGLGWTVTGRRLKPPDEREFGESEDYESGSGWYDR